MTEDELVTRLATLAKDAKEGDIAEAAAHIEAECLLCDFLTDLGYSNVAKAFNRIQPKRYA